MATEKHSHSFAVENDLAGKTDAQVEQERQLMAERAERGRRRLTMNRAFLHKAPKKSRKPPKP